jgi:hypothetical protein
MIRCISTLLLAALVALAPGRALPADFRSSQSADASPANRAGSGGVIFTDATADVGLAEALKGAFVHAIAWGDFDNDGLLDLFVGNFADRSPLYGLAVAPRNMLFRQSPRGRFQRFPCPPVEVAARCSGAVFADLDNDGDLDLYVTSNTLAVPTKTGDKVAAQRELSRLYRNDGQGRFVDITDGSGVSPPTLLRARDIGVFDFNADGLLDLLVMQDKGVAPNDAVTGLHFFRNRGGLKFDNVTAAAGLPNDLWGAGIAVADLNGDRRADFYICGGNRLYLSRPDFTYREAEELRAVFNPPEGELDWVTGACFGDLDLDGDLDLITGRHHYYGPSRIHLFLNDGVRDGVPRFREVTSDLKLQPLPQKAPHPEIRDFDNDGVPDLFWSAWFTDGDARRPFLCRGLGVQDGLPRFDVPSTEGVQLRLQEGKVAYTAPANGPGMVYYVATPAVDFDADGDLDMLAGMWPDEPSRFFRNDTASGHWLEVQSAGGKANRMGLGARVSVYQPGQAGITRALVGVEEITLNGGYAASRPAIAHFGLGKLTNCDVVVEFPPPAGSAPVVLRHVTVDRVIKVEER